MQTNLDIIQLISIFELFIASSFTIVLAIFMFRKYREREDRTTIFLMMFFLCEGIALIFVAMGRIEMAIFLDTSLGLIFHVLAIYTSFLVVVSIGFFAIEITFPEHFTKLAILIIILVGIGGFIFAFATPIIDLIAREITYSDEIFLVIGPFLFPPIIIGVSVFFYYAKIIKNDSRPKYFRSLTMGIAGIFLSCAYILELIGFTGFIVIIIRSGFVINALLYYISYTLPKWYQKAIGWEELT